MEWPRPFKTRRKAERNHSLMAWGLIYTCWLCGWSRGPRALSEGWLERLGKNQRGRLHWDEDGPQYQGHLNFSLLWPMPAMTKHTHFWQQICWASKRVQQVQALATQAWSPEFEPQHPSKGGQREPTPLSCPLTSTCWTAHVHPPPHIN